MIILNQYINLPLCFQSWTYGVMVSTLDSESNNPSSNLGMSLFFIHFSNRFKNSKLIPYSSLIHYKSNINTNRYNFCFINMSKPAKIIPEKTIGVKSPETKTSFTDNEAILYSLGIGFSQDPLKEADFKYTYELNEEFAPFPTMAAVINKFDLVSPFMANPDFPEFSPFQILHAEQRLELVQPKLFPGKQYIHRQEVIDVNDKGKNALCVVRINSYIKNNEGKQQLAFFNDMSIIIRGMGGFGFKGKGATKALAAIPKRSPDQVIQSSSYANQALLYRLTGDINPLHVDPNIASIQNYQKPILHGLASYGNVCRAIVQELLNNQPEKIKAYQARFVGHVFPGEKYTIKIWKEGNTIIFEALVKQRDSKCLVGSIQLVQEAKL